MSATDLAEGILQVTQGKTKAKLRIVVEGELASLLDEIAAHEATRSPKSMLRAPALLVNEEGERPTSAMLRKRFDAARDAAGIDKAAFQFSRPSSQGRPKAHDTSSTRSAQALLGHTTETMTADYIRHKVRQKGQASQEVCGSVPQKTKACWRLLSPTCLVFWWAL